MEKSGESIVEGEPLAFHGIADCLRPRLRHARNSPTQPHFPYTHGTAVDFIVPDRELAAAAAACGSSERKLLTPRLGDVPWEIEARRESRGSIRRSWRGGRNYWPINNTIR